MRKSVKLWGFCIGSIPDGQFDCHQWLGMVFQHYYFQTVSEGLVDQIDSLSKWSLCGSGCLLLSGLFRRRFCRSPRWGNASAYWGLNCAGTRRWGRNERDDNEKNKNVTFQKKFLHKLSSIGSSASAAREVRQSLRFSLCLNFRLCCHLNCRLNCQWEPNHPPLAPHLVMITLISRLVSICTRRN